MTELRAMTNADLLAYKRLCSICYTYQDTNAPEELPEELLRMRMGVFGEDGTLHSAMMQIPYDVRFAGKTVKLVGIGGVVTDPSSRGQRGVRRLFEEGLPRLYREGCVFSALYPFSHRFYRKFGYASAEFWRDNEFSRTSIRADLRQADEIIRVLPEEDDRGMRAIYEAWAANRTLAVLRDDQMWKEMRRGTPWDSLKHAYVLRIGGESVAYWIGTMHKAGRSCTVNLADAAWTTREGMEAIFAMLRGMNEVENVRVRMMGGFDPRHIVEEPYDVSVRGVCDAMVRVVNAERALSLLPAPRAAGRLCIGVKDEQIPANCGTFILCCDGERLAVHRDDGACPDITCSIHGLAALVLGRASFADTAAAGMVQVEENADTHLADLLFRPKELCMNWSF